MKKLLLTAIILLVTTISASAQWFVGGSLDITAGDNSRISIAPEAGFAIDDKLTVAAKVTLNLKSPSSYILNPYLRYSYFKTNKVNFFIDGGVGIHIKGDSGWNLAFKPGVSYSINDHWTVLAHVGDVGYYHLKSGHDFRIRVDNVFGLTLYYCF